MRISQRHWSTVTRILLAVSLCLATALTGCGDDDDGGCPGVLIPSCTSAYLSQCPECSSGDDGWCVGHGFGSQRCCGCGDPP